MYPDSLQCNSNRGTEGLAPRAKAFWDWLQDKGWEGDFASISGLLAKQGIPDNGNSEDPVAKGLENFFDLFGDGENKIPRTHLSRFTSMHCSKGVKGLAPRAKAFWGWLQGKGWVDDFASISGLLTKQGIPNTGNNADPVVKGAGRLFRSVWRRRGKNSPKTSVPFHLNALWQGSRWVSPPGKGILGLVAGQGLGG